MIELTIVIIIIAIMATFGMPAFFAAIDNQTIKGTARDVFSIFKQARLEAIKRNSNVVIAFTPQAYTVTGGVGSYQVFVDDGAGGGTGENHIRDGSEGILTTFTMPNKISLYLTTFAASSTAFNGRGLPTKLGRVELRNSNRWYRISLSVAGNVNMQLSQDGTWPP